jgi:hypothetical protein
MPRRLIRARDRQPRPQRMRTIGPRSQAGPGCPGPRPLRLGPLLRPRPRPVADLAGGGEGQYGGWERAHPRPAAPPHHFRPANAPSPPPRPRRVRRASGPSPLPHPIRPAASSPPPPWVLSRALRCGCQEATHILLSPPHHHSPPLSHSSTPPSLPAGGRVPTTPPPSPSPRPSR